MAIRRALIPALLLGAALGGAAGVDTSATPISKVLEMMDEMLAKGEAAMKDEEVKFSAFSQWCGDQSRIKKNEIEASEDTMAELTASIEKGAATIKKLTERIEELEEDVSRWDRDQKASQAVRDKENEDYRATHKDYSESIDAVTQAIKVIAEKQGDVAQALVQLRSRRVMSQSAKAAVTSYLDTLQPSVEAMPDEMLSREAPEANAYEGQSGGILDMLEKLKDEFSTKKTDLEMDEKGAQNAFGKIMQVLADNTENAEHEISKKTALRAETQEQKARDEGDLEQTTNDRDEDRKYLFGTQALCDVKTKDFESRQKLRGEELEAIKKAKEIISSGAVAGAGDKHLPALIQVRAARAGSFVQVGSEQQSPLQAQTAAFLAEAARRSGSELLSKVSQQVASDPFKKVKKMIKGLIVKLMDEATSEIEHKGWCDTELGTNKQTRDKKTSDINKLNSDIEDLTAEIAQLTQDVTDLNSAIKELDAAVAKETEERQDSKEKSKQTVEDAQEAQAAVESAIEVLKDFYAKSAQATALAQQSPAEDAPETFDKPYKGMGSQGGGVVDFLEVILSDFARLESSTAANEAAEQDSYEQFMFESKKDKALKTNEIEHKTARRADAEGELQAAKEDLKNTQDQLDKAVTYYEKLKPECVDSGINYEDRVKRREAEMQSLKEALNILTS